MNMVQCSHVKKKKPERRQIEAVAKTRSRPEISNSLSIPDLDGGHQVYEDRTPPQLPFRQVKSGFMPHAQAHCITNRINTARSGTPDESTWPLQGPVAKQLHVSEHQHG